MRLNAALQQTHTTSAGYSKQYWRKKSDSGYESSSSFTSSSLPFEYKDGSVFEKGEGDDLIIHTIILPNYKEDKDTLKETFLVLACQPQAKSSYEVRPTKNPKREK